MALSAMKLAALWPVDAAATTVAEIEATVALGPTKSSGQAPKMTYPIKARGTAYRPYCTGTPAIDAYAIDSGTTSAQTVNPAMTSLVRKPRS